MLLEKESLTYLSSNKKNTVYSEFWIPENPKLLFQIAHGMVEHIGRYENFAKFLNENNIVVFGNDHLGHGETVSSKEEYGYFSDTDGNKHIIEDMYTLTKIAKEKFPNLPIVFLGHSMGSYLLRRYICEYGNEIDGAIIMATGNEPDFILKLGIFLTEFLSKIKGWNYRSKLIDNLAFDSFNQKFGEKSGKQWLSRDKKEVLKYELDPKCNFIFTLNAYNNLFKIILDLYDEKILSKIPKDLDIILLAGSEDPVGDFGKSVKKVYEKLKSLGIKNIDCKLYEKYRHEILNEIDKEIVYNDILNWVEKFIK